KKDHARVIRATMTRNYGSLEMRFEIEVGVDPIDAEDQDRHFELLAEQLRYHHENFASKVLPKIPRTGALEQGEKRLTEFDADRIVVSVHNGKTYYNVVTKTGRYSKFGATIWKEELEKYGIVDLMDGKTEMPLAGVKVKIEEREKGGAVRSFEGLP